MYLHMVPTHSHRQSHHFTLKTQKQRVLQQLLLENSSVILAVSRNITSEKSPHGIVSATDMHSELCSYYTILLGRCVRAHLVFSTLLIHVERMTSTMTSYFKEVQDLIIPSACARVGQAPFAFLPFRTMEKHLQPKGCSVWQRMLYLMGISSSSVPSLKRKWRTEQKRLSGHRISSNTSQQTAIHNLYIDYE